MATIPAPPRFQTGPRVQATSRVQAGPRPRAVRAVPRAHALPGTVALLLAATLSGCAARPAGVSPARMSAGFPNQDVGSQGVRNRVAEGAAGWGVVLAARPVTAAQASAARAVLAALGPGAAFLPAHRRQAEVLVGDGDGHVVSVLEPADRRFRAGERVRILPGPAPRLVRAGHRA